MPVVDYKTYVKMLDTANKNKYAYPAINVSDLETANACLAGFAEAKSDGIIQVSTGGGEHASGTGVKDMVLGAISLANHVHLMAQKYNVNIALHTEEGALVQFSRDHALFQAPGLIYGENLENIAITGRGIIDGAGDAWRYVKRSKLTENQWQALVASGGRLSADGQEWYPRTNGETWRPRLLALRLRCNTASSDRAYG